MSRSLDAPLSPHEEATLRRVALGASRPRDLAARDLARLKRLTLIEDVADTLQLTAAGRKRYDALLNAAGLHDTTSYQGASLACNSYASRTLPSSKPEVATVSKPTQPSAKLVRQVQDSLDDALQDSFPASDPVSFLQASPVKSGDRPLSTVKVNGRAATSRSKR